MISDWREVYRQEKRRPGYVIENGKSVDKISMRNVKHFEMKPSRSERNAA